MHLKLSLATSIAGVVLISALSHQAWADQPLFTPTPYGPIAGLYGVEITGGYGAADSFTLTGTADITSIDFTVLGLGDNISSTDWAITSTPFDATYDSGAHAFSGYTGTIYGSDLSDAPVSGNFVTSIDANPNVGGLPSDVYNEYSDSFSTGAVSLAAGTYYINIGEANTDDSTTAYWESTDYAPNTAAYTSSTSIYPTFYSSLPEAFTVNGYTPAPEMSSFTAFLTAALSGIGFLGLRRFRRNQS